MASVIVGALRGFAHALDGVIVGVAVGEPIGGDETYGVAAVIALDFALGAAKELKICLAHRAFGPGGVDPLEGDFARSCARCDVEVNETVVGAVSRQHLMDGDTGVVDAHVILSQAVSMDHDLQAFNRHVGPPEWRVNAVYKVL